MKKKLVLATLAAIAIAGGTGTAGIAEAGCVVNIGHCASTGHCTVNYGTCDNNGQCLVTVGHCGDGDSALVAL
jgi:hypothetical protein